MHKFKLNDIITLIDNPLDEAVQSGDKGYYQIIEVTTDSYGILSLKRNYKLSAEEMWEKQKHAMLDYGMLAKKYEPSELLEKYPVHPGIHCTPKDMFESAYRLVTKEELANLKVSRVLYSVKV